MYTELIFYHTHTPQISFATLTGNYPPEAIDAMKTDILTSPKDCLSMECRDGTIEEYYSLSIEEGEARVRFHLLEFSIH